METQSARTSPHSSTRSEPVDRWRRALLRTAGLGGASVPLAVLASRLRSKTAGETPAPPARAACGGYDESRVHASTVVRNPSQMFGPLQRTDGCEEVAVMRLGLRWRSKDGVIGSRDGY